MDDLRTLEQLENDFWGDPPKNATSLIRSCYLLRRKRMGDLEAGDIRLLIGQNIGLEYLVPLALRILDKNLFVEADLYEGDLLRNVLRCDKEFWRNNASLASDVLKIIRKNVHRLDELDFSEKRKYELKQMFNDFGFIEGR